MRGGQLGLLLWKNYVVRKRRPAILGLVFLWPIAVFLLLYTVRDNVDPEYNPTCQFPSRLMPHDGLLPFVQSYICSLGNACESLDEYEELPTYKNSTLGPLMKELQPVLGNETIITAVKTLPKSIQLLKSMAQILTKPEIKKLFERGIRLGDLFNNHEIIKNVLRLHLPKAEDNLIDGLMNASIKLYYLIETFGSSNLDGVICSPESLKKYLLLENDEDLLEISKILCNIDSKKIPDILEHLTRHLDFSGLLEMVGRATAKFHDYDFIDDLVRALNTVLDLKTVKKYVPTELKLQEWLPKIVALFRNVSLDRIDLTLINKTIDELEPIFSTNQDWPLVRHGLVKFNSLLEMIDDVVLKKKSHESSPRIVDLSEKVGHDMSNISTRLQGYDDVTRILDSTYAVLHDAVKLTNRIIDRNEDQLKIATEVLDGLRDFFPQNIMNVLTYVVSMSENVIRIIHHVAIIHEEIAERLYNVSLNNRATVNNILTTVNPEAFRTIVQSISRLDFTERLVDGLRTKKPQELFCQEAILDEMFQRFKDFGGNSSIIKQAFCSDSGKSFVADVYGTFEFDNFRQNVDDTLSTFISMALGQPVRINKSNLTSLVTSVKNFVIYLEKVSPKWPDWSVFGTFEEWNEVFLDTRIQSRIDVLGIHLSMARAAGMRSISYITIKPDLQHMDMIADMILLDLREHPTSWIGKVREHESELIESFYMTVADRKKTLKILEYSNFTASYCTNDNPPDLLNFPERSNATLLKDLICRLAKSVQTDLQFNVTEFEANETGAGIHHAMRDRGAFNWTSFNKKTLEIYEYIETLLPQIDEHYDEERLVELKKKFVRSWTKDLSIRDAWEISVGFICKILDIAESPIFDVRERTSWEVLYPLGRAASLVAGTIERVVDQIRAGNHSTKLSEVLHDLPQTEILLDVLLRNLAPLTSDLIDFMTSKSPMSYVALLKDYPSQEVNWPCIEKQSVGAVLNLRAGSQAVIREIERVTCNPGAFVREWRNHELFSTVRSAFDKNNKNLTPIPVFNWTRGYERFRMLVDKIEKLINDSKNVTVTDDQGALLYSGDLLPGIKKMMENGASKVEDRSAIFFDFIDTEIEANVEVLKSDRSAADAWSSLGRKRNIDDFLVIGKFFTRMVHDTAKIFLDTVGPDATSVSLFGLLGFTDKSVVRVVYEKGPFILATILNGMSDPSLDSRIYNETRNQQRPIACSDIFSWFQDYRYGLSGEDYLKLKNTTCDGDPENFNAFTDLYLRLTTVWRQPVSQYRTYFATLVSEVWQLADRFNHVAITDGVIDLPSLERYFDRGLILLKDALTGQTTKVISNHYANTTLWTYRLAIEGIAEVLDHAVDALNDLDPGASVVHTWDLVPSGDVKQLLKILESHPVETIALASSLTTYNTTTDSIPSFKELRHFMCVDRFRSSYWRRENRSHFLDTLCTFDANQLLRRATSDQFYEPVINASPIFRQVEPLSKTLTKFINALENRRTSSGKRIQLVSNVLNSTTWLSLAEDIRDAEKSWAHKLATTYSRKDGSFQVGRAISSDALLTLMQAQEIAAFLFDIFAGGDVWSKMKINHETPRSKAVYSLIEDTPNLVVTFIDTFANSERLNDFFKRFLQGSVNGCDIDKYLIPPGYIRRKGYLSSIGNFCQKFIYDNASVSYDDLLPITFWIRSLHSSNSKMYGENSDMPNETEIFQLMLKLQKNVLRLLHNGTQPARVPSWWTSFEAGTWTDFTNQYQNKNPKPMIHSIIDRIAIVFKDIIKNTFHDQPCTWCNSFIVQILNSQLSRHEIYSNLLCDISRLEYSKIRQIVDGDLYWNKTINMVKGYQYFSKRNDPEPFVSSVKDAVQYVADIIVDYKMPRNAKNLTDCFFKAVGASESSGTGFYIKALIGIVDSLQQNIHVFDTATSHEKLSNLTRVAEKFVPIWRPVREVVKLTQVEKIDRSLPNSSINVNLLLTQISGPACPANKICLDKELLRDFLSSKRSNKLLQYDPKTAKYPSIPTVTDLLAESLDLEAIDNKIGKWRRSASWNFDWLRETLKHLAAFLEEGGNLVNVASKVDFNDVSSALGVPDIADGVINLLKDKTIDKLFEALKEIVDDVTPFIEEEDAREDLRKIVETFESMEIFKNLGLLDLNYVVSEMFVDWNDLRRFLVEDIGIPDAVANTISKGKIDMLSVFMKERRAISLKDTVCSSERLQDMLSFDSAETSAEQVSSALCDLNDSATQNVTIELIKNLNFEYIFSNLMSANVKNILKNANLTEIEGQEVFDSIGVAAELVPFFKDKLSSGFSADGFSQGNEETISTGRFLQDASKMLCGQALLSDSGEFYKVISSIEDNKKSYDPRELASLPTEFCKDTYKNFLATSGGKIIWSYVKPLLRGRILYAPKTSVVNRIMSFANETFSQIDTFGVLMDGLEKTLRSLASLSEMGQSLKDLKDVMASKVMRIAIKSMSNGRMEADFGNFDLGDIAWKLSKSTRLTDMIGMLNDFLKCVLVNRIQGFATEEALEIEARNLIDTKEFLAGVVFVETPYDESRSKRSSGDDPEDELHDDVVYKIRMDVDYVPSTKRLKTQFWLPGPEASFIEDLRYLRGFVQLQDSIDRAVIREKSGRVQNWKTVTQQMPYPCWKRTPFITTLYESQGVIVCFFFALMMCVGSAVRYIVWERESHNSMVMSVMGLKPWRNTLAWFATTYMELTIVMIFICIILVAGKILPHTDPLLLLLLLLDYVFSIVSFCYMISTIFSSASLAAVTTVVMFLLTYMPYVIVIAMEASMSLGWKFFISLSMSTSFSYGCLYIVRREVQGTGMTWDLLWEESTPGDSMSLGFVLLMIALDGIIYAFIGYFVARYTNSDEDSDPGSMIVSEKQVGVRFEAVRKVFQTEKGDFVAVDDFTLKLCEGEVTSLLGRNGAGKTTIIKMLTGMMAPTSGEIYLNGDEDTKPDIGVCPQENVLIDTLTPREHMTFYARLKRPSDEEAMLKDVNSMLVSLELGRQEHEPVHRLSGGTKRRLCVALAFLGSPKLVILDEPGAGVDPAARRRIWRLIDQHRVNRTVLLSTHHLDEADMLSDTVVVMHRGKILCTGSPLSLKVTYGHGYWLHVEFPIGHYPESSIDPKSLEKIRSMVENSVPNSTIDEKSSTDLVITMPFNGKHGEANDIAAVVKLLEDNKKTLGFAHISLECDSLERVFLDLCSRADTGYSAPMRLSMDSVASVGSIGLTVPTDDVDLMIGESAPNPKPLRQARALLKKRLWHFARDWRSPLATLILPTIFVAVAMGFSLIRPPSGDEPPLDLNPKLYDTHPTYFYSIDNGSDPFLQHVSLQLHNRFGGDYAGAWQTHPNDTGICECTEGQQVCHGVSKGVEGLYQTLPGRPTLDWIVSTFQEYIEKRYGGWSLSHAGEDPLFVVWYNNKGHHALPAYLNALNEAILQASGSSGHLTTLNHPLKLSSDQLNRTTLVQHVADVGVALVLLIAFSLVAAQGAKELVRERLSEEKRILYLAGVHPVTYWTTALIWDFLVFLGSILLAVIVFKIFGLSSYVARDNLAGVCLILFLFAWAAIPFTHLVEKAFDDSSLSNMVLFCLNTFVGVASLATILVIDILGKSQTARDTRNFLHHTLLLFPQYALGDALVEITKNDITAELLGKFQMDTYKSPLGWELLGLHYTILFIVGILLYAANLVVECGYLPDWPRGRPSYENVEEDEDVVRERIRAENGGNNDVIKTVRLRKEYRSVYGTNVAVQNLSFGVAPGTCFGLLGVNGAGKSSTFRMLTTETRPTSGEIILHGRSVGKRPLCDGQIGYCPQSDALDAFLSPHQCLTVHGEICGLDDVPRSVETMLKRFDLIKYAHQRVSSLSGGNKRKLCAAISVMSPVSVVLMDEPTSGMDPASKELVANAVRLVTRSRGCVIMTSHSVTECENLCNRVGILARAGLRCIGSVQHLKHKFGEGYVAFLRFGLPISPKDLKEAIARHLPTGLISSRQAMAARLLIPRSNEVTLSSTFLRVKQLAEELKATDYTLTQSSLDQVLVNFSEEMEDETLDSRYGQRSRVIPNVYTNVQDAIHMETF
ncbi:uncharacterized protein ldd isoform X2 [Venturia canescens]|uniref:uncharacterized protein ldd isoform X2 n=1 Tax=Venturia canescens TaxID=32260 RepID=UPI001C9C9F11|nr:uncharacterized protein LOC122419466 isoform X2 [Venturia canescens]